jgi:hypothetical protein
MRTVLLLATMLLSLAIASTPDKESLIDKYYLEKEVSLRRAVPHCTALCRFETELAQTVIKEKGLSTFLKMQRLEKIKAEILRSAGHKDTEPTSHAAARSFANEELPPEILARIERARNQQPRRSSKARPIEKNGGSFADAVNDRRRNAGN